MITTVNHVEPVPRRIRAYLGTEKVLDTTRALYVWEWPYYPQYYVPLADVRQDLLTPEGRAQQTGRGKAELHALRAGEVHRPRAARLITESAVDGLDGTVRFEWAALEPPGARGTRRGRAGRLGVPGDGVRDWPADAVLRQPHRCPLRAPSPHRHGDRVPLQGDDQRLLVGPGRRHGARGPGLGVRLSHPPAPAHHRHDRLLQREGRHVPRR